MNLDQKTKEMLASKVISHLNDARMDDFNFGEQMQGSISAADKQPDVTAYFVASINRHESAANLAARKLGYQGWKEVSELTTVAEKFKLDPIQVISARLPNK